jgi:carbamoyl-phosphate synthase small subunit
MKRPNAALVLQDGEVFEGYAVGFLPEEGVTTGEFVFNTALSGYQEVLTDPSYAGQVVAFTYPHIGNYGITPLDDESVRPWAKGVIMRELADLPSNWRSAGPLEGFLAQHRIPAMAGIDTRRLTRHLRSAGALPGAFGHGAIDTLREAAKLARGTDQMDFVSLVTTREVYQRGAQGPHIVAVDYGIKATMVRQLADRFRVTVVPAHISADEILSFKPDGLFLSNGPGDPVALAPQVQTIADLVEQVPIFGICLGHQLLATALGGKTYKLPFGHHGSNHPVQDLATGRIEITAQNHNYAVDAAGLRAAHVSHVNLNDGVVEGIAAPSLRAFSVQYHPEAGPGPHDARYLFDRFDRLLDTGSLEAI